MTVSVTKTSIASAGLWSILINILAGKFSSWSDGTVETCFQYGVVFVVSAQNRATCDGLDGMIQRTVILDCTRDAGCGRVDCVTANSLFGSYSVTMTLLSCRNPPGNIIICTQDIQL